MSYKDLSDQAGLKSLFEAAATDKFLLPLIGELRLNLVLDLKRCPAANITHKAHSMALTSSYTQTG